jgi:taurine--2-oxoglutarate transaminase
VASVRAFHDEGIVERARRLGDEVLGPGLRELMERHPSVGEVRGRGCFWGVELVKDRATREMLVPFNAAGAALAPITELLAAARARGAVLLAHWNVLIVAPPLTTPDDDARHGLQVLDEVLEIADRVAAA